MFQSDPQSKIRLKNLSLEQMVQFVSEMGEKRFRARQIIKWLYQKRVSSFEEMTNMSKPVRAKLTQNCTVEKLEPRYVLESKYGDAVKFGFVLPGTEQKQFRITDKLRIANSGTKNPPLGEQLVESVLLIDDKRRTACVSSQLGCALGCTFCETGKLGFVRNLTQEEIIGQLIGINDYLFTKGDRLVTNIVFMGMGEALSNFDNFRSSLEIIMDEDGFNIGARRITVSSAGVVPSIERLMRENLTIGLAISLNAWNNEQRSLFMPINEKYPIEQLVAVAKRYFHRTGRRVTFEYVVIDGVTNTVEAADALKRLLGGFPCKVNLIALNPAGNNDHRSPEDRIVDRFAEELHRRDLAATVRRSRGQDIMGACGQLAGSVHRKKEM
ncbi:MAG: 23S rRNA (adenine(2503)-C(2))-methyltransferase RlmN [Chitinispirillaceae bacterium]